MAIIWERATPTTRYKVTRAGASTRLYTDGVFHSQYNPRRPIAGSIWDLLFIPALMHPRPTQLRRVLVLGVGGGAVIRQLNDLLQPQSIVGVELDSTHIEIAKKFFGVNQNNVQLVHGEAHAWLEAYGGEAFDLIIEDLFIDNAETAEVDPVRAIAADNAWFRLLRKHLTPQGVLVMNFESSQALSESAYRNWLLGGAEAGRRWGFASAYRFAHRQYQNVIGAFISQSLARGQFVQQLRQFKPLDQRRRSCQLQFTYRKL